MALSQRGVTSQAASQEHPVWLGDIRAESDTSPIIHSLFRLSMQQIRLDMQTTCCPPLQFAYFHNVCFQPGGH
jgi:hypothetical protein